MAITADRGGDEGGDSGVAVRLERAGETEARRVGAEAEGTSLLLPPAAAPRRRSCELDCSVCSVRAVSPPLPPLPAAPHAGASAVDLAGEDGVQAMPSSSATWLRLGLGQGLAALASAADRRRPGLS